MKTFFALYCVIAAAAANFVQFAPAADRKTSMRIESSAFKEGQVVPKKHTGEGGNLSPALSWSGVPAGTRELALICDDPDAPTAEPWVHWLIYGIPADTSSLPEGIKQDARPNSPAGATQGENSWNKIGYGGPMPPPGHGPHRYYFKLYALDTKMGLKPGLTKAQLLKAIKGHVIAEAQLMGSYERKKSQQEPAA